MDRYDYTNDTSDMSWKFLDIEEDQLLTDFQVKDLLNTLERELAAANAKIEKAMNELDGCDYDGQSGICDRIADILED